VIDLLLLSTSTMHGGGFLEYATVEAESFLEGRSTVLFVPYARPGGISHEAYTGMTRERFRKMGLGVEGVHETDDPVGAVQDAQAVFVGGGNTMPYMGSSAGSNVAGLTIGTTNDMPIVQPPSFEALGLIPFNINPHYLDPDPDSTHMGETRETRIREFHQFNDQPVLGLREGAMLRVQDDRAVVQGRRGGRLFRPGVEAEEIATDLDVSLTAPKPTGSGSAGRSSW
jgi:dipeptidase E